MSYIVNASSCLINLTNKLKKSVEIDNSKNNINKHQEFLQKMIGRSRNILYLVKTFKHLNNNYLCDDSARKYIKKNETTIITNNNLLDRNIGNNISFYNFVEIVFHPDHMNETIIRSLGNNKYFFDQIEENFNAIYTILNAPDKYFFFLSNKEMKYMKECLILKKRIRHVPTIVHIAITISNIYCAMNSDVYYDYLVQFSSIRIFDRYDNSIDFKKKIKEHLKTNDHNIKSEVSQIFTSNQEYINEKAIDNIEDSETIDSSINSAYTPTNYTALDDPIYTAPNDPIYAVENDRNYTALEDPNYTTALDDPNYTALDDPNYTAANYTAANDPIYIVPNDPIYIAANDPNYTVWEFHNFYAYNIFLQEYANSTLNDYYNWIANDNY